MLKKNPLILTQQQLAKNSGLTQSMIHYVLNGDRRPSVETALKLEKGAGLCREKWLFPERHYNPYMPFIESEPCLVSPYQVPNPSIQVKTLVKIVEDAEDRTN